MFDNVRRPDVESDGPTSEGLRENLHSTAKTKDGREHRLLDVGTRQRAAVLEMPASKDKALLIRGGAFLVLDLRLDVISGVGGWGCDDLASEGLHKDLHSTTKMKDEKC